MRTLVEVVILTACALSSGACVTDDVDADASSEGLVINEVAAHGVPGDWFELLNTSDHAIDLSRLVFVDRRGAMTRARHFPDLVLAPGQVHVQPVRHLEHGFALGESDGLFVYDGESRREIDHVAWPTGASPAAGSYARDPASGRFVTVTPASPGAPNRAATPSR